MACSKLRRVARTGLAAVSIAALLAASALSLPHPALAAQGSLEAGGAAVISAQTAPVEVSSADELEEAVEAAGALGATIKVGSDIKATDPVTLASSLYDWRTSGKIVVDFCGHAFTGYANANDSFSVDVPVTIKNATFKTPISTNEQTTLRNCTVDVKSASAIVHSNYTLTIESGTYRAKGQAVYVTGGNAEIRGGKFHGGNYAARGVQDSGVVNIYGGKLTGGKACLYPGGTVHGGTLDASKSSTGICIDGWGTIEDGKFVGTYAIKDTNSIGAMRIEGGDFTRVRYVWGFASEKARKIKMQKRANYYVKGGRLSESAARALVKDELLREPMQFAYLSWPNEAEYILSITAKHKLSGVSKDAVTRLRLMCMRSLVDDYEHCATYRKQSGIYPWARADIAKMVNRNASAVSAAAKSTLRAHLNSVKSAGKKTLALKPAQEDYSPWNYYQIQYKVKGASKSSYKTVHYSKVGLVSKNLGVGYDKTVKLTGLKSGKTYQVKVRGLMKIGNKKYYGKWTPAKTAKVK